MSGASELVMFKFSDMAVWRWKLGQTRNKHLYNHLYDNHSFWFRLVSRNHI